MKNQYKLWTGILGILVVVQSSQKVLTYTEGSMFWALLMLSVCAITVPLSMVVDYITDKNDSLKDRTQEYFAICDASKKGITDFMAIKREVSIPQGEIFCLYYDSEFGAEEGKVDVVGLYCTDTGQVYVKGSKNEFIHLNLIEKSDTIYLEAVLNNL